MNGKALGLTFAIMSGGGCATVFEGTTQDVFFVMEPRNAVCTVSRKAESLGSVSAANPVMRLTKSRNAIDVRCAAPDHREQTLLIDSSATVGGVSSIVFFDLGLTDWASGAMNKYPERITVTLTPLAPPSPR